MIKVGITGGIGSGKSTIVKAFEVLGAPTFKADMEAKRMMDEDPELVASIKVLFGESIYGPGGLKRQEVAKRVFQDRQKLQELDDLVHPKVRERFEGWCERQEKAPYVIEEAAILIESGAYKLMDHIILITADEERRIKRVMERDGIDEEAVRGRMKEQWSDEEKKAYADTVLANDDSDLILPRILEMDRQFRERDASR